MSFVGDILGGVKDVAGDIFGGVKDVASGVIGGVKDVASGVLGGVKDVVGGIGDLAGDVLGSDLGKLAALAATTYFGAPAIGAAGGGGTAFGGPISALASLVTGGSSIASGEWDWMKKSGVGQILGGPWSTAFSIGSGLYGMRQAQQTRQLAEKAAGIQDPFMGERAKYASELSSLYADPLRVERLPGYKAGLSAVERKMASQGYLGSGNMMLALQDYGGRAFDAEAARLASLAGAQFAPSGGQTLLSGTSQANELASKSLGSLGYGVRGLEDLYRNRGSVFED